MTPPTGHPEFSGSSLASPPIRKIWVGSAESHRFRTSAWPSFGASTAPLLHWKFRSVTASSTAEATSQRRLIRSAMRLRAEPFDWVQRGTPLQPVRGPSGTRSKRESLAGRLGPADGTTADAAGHAAPQGHVDLPRGLRPLSGHV